MGIGRNTLSLVEYALKFINNNQIELEKTEKYDFCDECWVVFDKDDFPKFDEAINEAVKNKLKVAYSNECFEIWYLLHFNYYNSALDRNLCNDKMTEILRKETGDKNIKYSKESKEIKKLDIYSLIKEKEKFAIKNAEKLKKQFGRKNPSTTVFELVETLNKLK